MEILTVQHLCKTYGQGENSVQALRDVSFTLQKGEFAAIVGESGSGKTTLLNLIGGLDEPSSGRILLSGQELSSMKEEERTVFRRRNIGFVFQSFQLIPELTVEQNIAFPLLLDCRKPDGRELLELLNLLGLAPRRNHLPCPHSPPHADPGRRTYGQPGQQEQPGGYGASHPGCPPLPSDNSHDHSQSRTDRLRGPGAPGN